MKLNNLVSRLVQRIKDNRWFLVFRAKLRLLFNLIEHGFDSVKVWCKTTCFDYIIRLQLLIWLIDDRFIILERVPIK